MSLIRAFYNKNKKNKTLLKGSYEPLDIKVYGTKEKKRRIKTLLSEINSTKTGKEIIKKAQKVNVYLEDFESLGAVDLKGKNIILNADKQDERLLPTLAHELTHANQIKSGLFPNLLKDGIRGYFMRQRASEASACVAGAVVAFELKEQGKAKYFDRLKARDKENINQFEKSMKEGKANKAKSDFFDSWYDSDYIKDEYDKTNIYSLSYSPFRLLFLKKKVDKTPQRKNSGNEITKNFCNLGGKPYYINDSSKLEKDKFLDITDKTRKSLTKLASAIGEKGKKDLAQMPTRVGFSEKLKTLEEKISKKLQEDKRVGFFDVKVNVR